MWTIGKRRMNRCSFSAWLRRSSGSLPRLDGVSRARYTDLALICRPKHKLIEHLSPCRENCLVTRKDIARTIADELGLSQRQTSQIVHNLFDAIVNTLAEEGRVELRNFGVFEVRRRKARKARNPRTGGQVMVPEKCVVAFKPGQELEERVQTENRIVVTGGTSHRRALTP